MKQVEAFRIQVEDTLRAVARSAIEEAKITELRMGILKSDKSKVCAFLPFLVTLQLRPGE